MKTFLLRLIRQTDGYQLLPYTLAGILDRNVALKVLPDAFTADPDRLARFEREAKVLASLNHSNIGAIYITLDTRKKGASRPTTGGSTGE